MIRELLDKGLVTQALEKLRVEAAAYPGESYADRVEALRTEFGYMSDYMLKGYRDDKRGELFEDLKERMTALDFDLHVRRTLLENPILKVSCRDTGESYGSAVMVMQKLDEATGLPEKYDVLTNTFNALLVSRFWTSRDEEEWTSLLVSVNPVYASVLVAALTLSVMTNYCQHKALCLSNVYLGGSDDKLRQRALVGAMLAVSRRGGDEAETAAVLERLMTVSGATGDVLSLQMQLLACAAAESDAREINDNIMPNLVKNQPFRLSKNGFVEKDEEKDSFDPDADARMMESVQAGVDRMVRMQKNGSDVFFSGFSAMKRFPFFVKTVNWFTPFTKENPGISQEMNMLGQSPLVNKVMENGPFCDSDKYSFILGYGSVYKSMPDNVRKMVEDGEVSPLGMGDAKAQATPGFARLQFLQDMYRFFKLNAVGGAFCNPFSEVEKYLPAVAVRRHVSDLSRKTLFSCMLRDERLWKLPVDMKTSPLTRLLASFENKEGYDYLSCMAEFAVRTKNSERAMEYYSRCLRLKPDDPAMMRGMARACYATKEYAKAAFYYDALHTLFPKRKSYVLNYAMSMVMDGMAESVVNDVYKLEYENPDDAGVLNTLGWVLLHAGKAEQAADVYAKMLGKSGDSADFSVLLNAFYAQLATGHAMEAVEMMKKYCQTLGQEERAAFAEQLADAMREDGKMLQLYDIKKAEKSIIVSQLAFLP